VGKPKEIIDIVDAVNAVALKLNALAAIAKLGEADRLGAEGLEFLFGSLALELSNACDALEPGGDRGRDQGSG